jgi:hypothetical protein
MANGVRSSLPANQIAPVIVQFDAALHEVFWILVVLAIVVAVVGFMLPRGRGLRLTEKT